MSFPAAFFCFALGIFLTTFTMTSSAVAEDGGILDRLDELEKLQVRVKTLEDLPKRVETLNDALEALSNQSERDLQIQAQAICVAIANAGSHVRATARPNAISTGWDIDRPVDWQPSTGQTDRVSCNTICEQTSRRWKSTSPKQKFGCQETLHVYRGEALGPFDSVQQVTGLYTVRYGRYSCEGTHSGTANFCCCSSNP